MKFSAVALFVASAIAAPQFGKGKGKSATGKASWVNHEAKGTFHVI
jgi:hypothetical protein